MIGAVRQVHRDVDHREAERAGAQIVAHAGVDGLDILAWHHAAGDGLGELETGPARQRLDVQHHVAELAVAAGLLLVPAALCRALADGLAIGNGGRPHLDGDLVLALQPLDGDAQVHLAMPGQDGLGRILVVPHGQRGVFLGQPLQRGRHLDLVLPLLRLEREGIDRSRRLERRERSDAGPRRGQRVARARRLQLAQRHRIAGGGRRDLGLAGAQHAVEAGDLGHVRGPAAQLHALRDRARQHAGHRQLAAMRRVHRLHHLHDGRAVLGEAEARARRRDVRPFVAYGLQEPQHAVALFGGADQHRRHRAGAQVGRQIVEHLVARRLLFLQKLLHQEVVMVRQLLQHGEARLDLAGAVVVGNVGDLGVAEIAPHIGALQRQVDGADDGAVAAQGDLSQQQRHGAGRLKHLERLAHAERRLVDLVEEQDARHAVLVQLAQDELQGGDLLLVGLRHHHREVAGGEHGLGLKGEFHRAGAVHEGQRVAHELRRGEAGFHAHGVRPRLGRTVGHGAARRNGILARYRAGAGEYGFKKGRFSAGEGTDDGDAFRSRTSSSGAVSHGVTSTPGVSRRAAAGPVGRRAAVSGLVPDKATRISSHGTRGRARDFLPAKLSRPVRRRA